MLPTSASVSSSESTAFGDSRTAGGGSGAGQRGIFISAATGEGNTASPSFTASNPLPWYAWAGIAVVGIAVFLILKKKG
jgi:LPXTG-motif cell wall-anchored protein